MPELWKVEDAYFLEPALDQSIAIARLLKRWGYKRRTIAVCLPQKSACYGLKSTYSSVMEVEDYRIMPPEILVVPGGASSTLALLRDRDIRLGNVTMPKRSAHVFDKLWFIRFCRQHGFLVPETWERGKDVPKDKFPIFYKQKREEAGRIRGIAHNIHDIPHEQETSLIFQEYIDSPGTYGVAFLASEGHLLTSHVHYEIESFPKTGGSGVIVEAIDSPDPRLIALVKDLLLALEFSGWGLIELKYDLKREEYVLMEINAKFWASCELAFRNNPDFMRLLFGVQKGTEHVKRMFFVNRAVARGPHFVISHLSEFRKSTAVYYPGLVPRIIHSMTHRVKKTMRRN